MSTTKTPMANPTPSATYQGIVQPAGFPPLPAGWESEVDRFASADGKAQLFAAFHHRPVGGPRVLIIFHGLNEHGGRYLHAPHYLQGAPAALDGVYCVDHRGHGRSEGLRGHVDRFDDFTDDAAVAIKRLDGALRSRYGSSEIHVLGHSMGGLVTLRALFQNTGLPIRSVTVTSPLLGIKVALPLVKRAAARMLSHVWGSLHMDTEIDPSLLSHDPEVGRVYLADRLVHKKGTPKLYTELTAAIADTNRRDSGIDYPLQVIVPLQDAIVDPEATLAFYRNLKHREKQLKTYPTFFHEVLNEVGKEQVFDDIAAWIAKHH